MLALLLLILLAIVPGQAAAQAVQQSGPWTPGHAPVYVTPSQSAVPRVQDSGPAGGASPSAGPGFTEGLYVVPPKTSSAPWANSGTGPYGTNWCDYDAPITNPAGYHYLCLSPNAAGGGLIVYGAGGGASPLPFNIQVNGTPFVANGVVNAAPIVPRASIPTLDLSSFNAIYVCGYTTCGDGGAALMVRAVPLLRPPSRWSGCATANQCVNDGVTNGTTTITSASAEFTTFDLNRKVADTGGCIPANDTIASIQGPNTATLATTASGTCTNDTFNFTEVASNRPGYIADLKGNVWAYDAHQTIVPEMFGATPQPNSGSVDSGAALQTWLDAAIANSTYGACGYLDGRYFSTIPLRWYIALAHPCLLGSTENQSQIVFQTGVASPNFQAVFAGLSNGAGGGCSGVIGNCISHSTFWVRLQRIQIIGSTIGRVCEIGDENNNDAWNGIHLDIACSNQTLYGTSLALNGIYNSDLIRVNVVAATPVIPSVTDAVFSDATHVSSAAHGFSSVDVGSVVDTKATNSVHCPEYTLVTAVSSGNAQLSQACSTNSVTNCAAGPAFPCTGQTVNVEAGTALRLQSVVNSFFTGTISNAALEIDMEDFGSYGNHGNTFQNIDYDGSPSIILFENGSNDFQNVVNSTVNNFGPDWFFCQAVAPNSQTYFTKFINMNPALTFSQPTNNQESAGVCALSGYYFWMMAAGSNQAGGVAWLPTPPVSGQAYLNGTGQAAYVFGKNQNLTGNGVELAPPPGVSFTTYVRTAVTDFQLYVPAGYTFRETCTGGVCNNAVLTIPAW